MGVLSYCRAKTFTAVVRPECVRGGTYVLLLSENIFTAAVRSESVRGGAFCPTAERKYIYGCGVV